MDYIAHYSSPLGGITLASDGDALVGLWFDGQKRFGAGLSADPVERPLPVFDDAARWLDAWFAGRDPGFSPRLTLRGTPFQRAVWAALSAIPYGRTATYGDISRAVAPAGFPRASARAVGGAVGRNPVSLIIPCHRVVGANGRLTGYAGGLERKRALLELESKNHLRFL